MKPSPTIHLLIVLMLGGLLLTGCQSEAAPTAVPTPAAGIPTGSGWVETGDLKALGTVKPVQTLQLNCSASGPIRVLVAQLGLEVKENERLVSLDTTALALELQRAGQEVALRQAQLDSLVKDPDAVLLARAKADHAQQVTQAEIALRMAQQKLEQARLQSPAPAVTAAQANLQQLELQLAQSRSLSPTPEVIVAQVNLVRAKETLADAQVEYQEALDRPWEPDEVRDAYARALRRAEQEVQIAQARLDGALGTQAAHNFGLEVVAAQRDAAEAQLAGALDTQAAYSLTLELLAAEVGLAQLNLDGLRQWENPLLDSAPPEEVTQARARLRQVELDVALLEWQMQGAELCAPFDGVISAVYLHPGEWCAPGTAVVELIDTSRWLVETRNVGELTIGRVHVGQEALVRVNAFRDETLRGRVVTISPMAVVQQGDTTYTLTIELEPTDLNLRPGMTVQVEILLS